MHARVTAAGRTAAAASEVQDNQHHVRVAALQSHPGQGPRSIAGVCAAAAAA